jgi:hypothetical protein
MNDIITEKNNYGIKDLLKPPFINTSTNILNGDNVTIFSISQKAAYTDVCHFLLRALKNQWERDFSEPLRWEMRRTDHAALPRIFTCPRCKRKTMQAENYCPDCGQKLKAPEIN